MRRIAILLTLFASACGGGGGEADGLQGPLEFTRSGGIAGRIDQLTIRPDGTATLTTKTSRQSFELTHAELAAIVEEVDAVESAPAESRNPRTVYDDFAYGVEYGGREVTMDGMATPDELSGLIGRLSQMVDDPRR
jgi:hypothetical protein